MYALNNALFSKVGNLFSQVVYIWNYPKLPGNTILQSAWTCAAGKWCWLCRPSSKSSLQLVCLCLLHLHTHRHTCAQCLCVLAIEGLGTVTVTCKSLCLCQNFPRKHRFWPLTFSIRFLKIIYGWPQYCSSFTFLNYIKWWVMILYQMPWKA